MKKLFMLIVVLVLCFLAKYDISVSITVSKEREENRALILETLKQHNPIVWALDYIQYDRCNSGEEHEEGVCKELREKY